VKTLHICEAEQLEVGDTLVLNGHRWQVIQIEEERIGKELRLRDTMGAGRTRFVLPDEIVTIEL